MRLFARDSTSSSLVPPPWQLIVCALAAAMVGCSNPADALSPDDDVQLEHSELTASSNPIVEIDGGRVRGVADAHGYAFLGVPYAAPPTGLLRWRPPLRPGQWRGVRDASEFAPNCPQPASTATKGPQDEDCLYLNVYAPRLQRRGERLPVLVWIHGGGFTTGAGRDYVPVELAANGVVVVTINYRLGALGFLAHPSLAAKRGGASGNYGLMDQQAALRWVQRNIAGFGGDPRTVTIAGESAGGLAVLVHLVSAESRGLFQRAIVQSGSFAMTQRSLADSAAAGEAFATLAGCSDQTARCLRDLPVDDLVRDDWVVIPGSVDGRVLTESVGTALAAGRFARVPILNGSNHDEELLFVAGLGVAVSGGTFVPAPAPSADSYQSVIAAVLGVSDARAAEIAAEYPLDAYPASVLALSALVGDANFACSALLQDRWTSRAAPTFAYEFNDDAAPGRYARIPAATHTSELPYLFDLPDAPVQDPLHAEQQRLASSMRAAWASFAASGDPSVATLPWPAFGQGRVMSLVPPQPKVVLDFASRHHCSFWAEP